MRRTRTSWRGALARRAPRSATCAAGAFLAAVAILPACAPADPPPAASEVLEAGPGAHWYRGNLHAHTSRSDGNAAPEAVAAWYRANGYHFLAISDHDMAPDAGQQAALESTFNAPGRFLVLAGEEISNAVGPLSVHVNAVNVAATIPPARAAGVEAAVAANHAAIDGQSRGEGRDILAQLNHPNFTYSITAEHLMRLPGTAFFEVYNGHPLSHNPGDGLHMSTESLWDVALAWRLDVLGLPLLYATAADDSHQYQAGGDAVPGRGWIQVLSGSLAPGALFDAMRAGRFYASTGVALKRIVATGDRLEVEVDPEPGTDYTIEFIGTRRGFDAAATPPVSATGRPLYASHRYDDAIGTVLSKRRAGRATYRFRDDDLYVRARVTASRRHHAASQPLQYAQAWVQPVVGPAGRRPSRPGLQAPAPPPPALHQGVTRRFQALRDGESARLLPASTIQCSLDTVTDDTGTPRPAYPSQGSVAFAGWVARPGAGRVPDSLAIVLDGARDYVVEDAPGRWRPDLAGHHGDPQLERAGFHRSFELGDVAPGEYRIRLVGFTNGTAESCDSGKTLRVAA